MLLLIIGLILFISLILIHEWGHFIAAKRNGVEVEEYGIFFPPRIWSKKTKGGWDFSINLLPIGGFVRLKGESDSDTRKGTFGAAPLKVKIKIMLAGVVMNLLVAFGLLTFLALVGMPQIVQNQFTIKSDQHIAKQEVLVGYIEPGSPAEKAGMRVGDTLSAIATSSCFTDTNKTNNCSESEKLFAMTSSNSLPNATEQLAGQEVYVSYFRGGDNNIADLRTEKIQLRDRIVVEESRKQNQPKGYLGVSPTDYEMKRYTWSAPVVAAGTMAQFTGLTFKGLGTVIISLFQGDAQKASEQVSGPVGIFAVMRDGTMLGYQFILMIVAIISLSLAIMNVLPIPALDGGKVFVTLVARLFKKRLTEKTEAIIYGSSFIFLLGLLVLITIVDVNRFF